MTWFLFALCTALAWGGADLFYKKGSDSNDANSHWKIVIMVGLVMGLHATGYWLLHWGEVPFGVMSMVRYLPVSALYISSMTIGYVGLRYLELSIASPVQNSSGAVTTILCLLVLSRRPGPVELLGDVLIFAGIIGLGVWEKVQEERARHRLNTPEEQKYRTGLVALLFPIGYCILDALGTFADALYLDEYAIMGEAEALLAYEYTFFLCAVAVFFYLRRRGVRMAISREKDKLCAAVLETTGQFFYVFAMGGNALIAAPLVATYSIFSVLFSRIFLKEKLKGAQYIAVVVVLLGTALLGLAEEL